MVPDHFTADCEMTFTVISLQFAVIDLQIAVNNIQQSIELITTSKIVEQH